MPIALPTDPDELQHLVDAAHGALALHAARAYGLVSGGPIVFPTRCEEVLEHGRQHGVIPSPDAIECMARDITKIKGATT